ncbi:solute carrier family 23 protein [Streptomyces sp. ID05-04B]|uniref:solute carrier family 23 protein n=1 Tax=Streptomyces sp. ID05-04B TaxID=3028661 RepID=UPI0039F6CC0F
MTQSLHPKRVLDDAGTPTRAPAGRSRLDRYFQISRRGSTVAREVRGGVTTFMAMAYILLLNPLILSGEDAAGGTLGQQALITATAFAAAFTTLLMGFLGKVPLAPAAGLSVSYVAVKAAQGRAREIGAFMWGLTARSSSCTPPSTRSRAGWACTSRP